MDRVHDVNIMGHAAGPDNVTMQGRGHMEIEDIIVGRRYREDLGDMEDLKRSISELGLLQPIVIRKGTNELVAGYRRLKALAELGMTSLVEGTHVNLVDIESLVLGEHDENICRKDFTISEKVAIFEAVKEEQLRIGVERQILAGARRPGDRAAAGHSGLNGAEDANVVVGTKVGRGHGHARSHAAKAVGLHQNTLRKASEIVAAARKEPRRYGHLVREMDLSGKVDPVFQKYLQERARPVAGAHGLCPSLSRMLSDRQGSVPEALCSAMACISFERQEELVSRFAAVFHLVRPADLDQAARKRSGGGGLGELPEDEAFALLGDILREAEIASREWVFMPQVKQVASIVMDVAKDQRSPTLDKLDFFMIGLAGFVDMTCNYLQVARKEGIIEDLPPGVLTGYLAVIDAFQMLYESKLPRRVGAARMREWGLRPGEMPDTGTLRDHANAMKANEMITDAAEGGIPYYHEEISNLVRNLRDGARQLAPTGKKS
ncbi:MAG: ParB N-terminal domain-containing protein [Syntrophorhabdus sp.]|nr:ParB N-terminal domain-containing protein [Syntrophorhabdus sp.]